jgi:hypothetical protein
MSALYNQTLYNQVFDWPDTDPDAFNNNVYEDNYNDYCPEGWDEEYQEEIYDEWPNRGRFGNLPSLSFLKANYVPPVTEPEAIDPYFTERHAKYEESLAKLNVEKEELIIKVNKVIDELKKAEDVPKTYSAAKWGAVSARDALVKRLTKDFDEAEDKVRDKTREINALVDANKNLCEYISINNSNIRFNEEYKKFREQAFEQEYGKVEPITEAAYIHLFYECQKVDMVDGSDVYRFENQVVLQRCMRALFLGKVSFSRIGWTDIQV